MPKTPPQLFHAIAASFVLINLLGCAAIFSGKEQKVQVSSMPAQATIFVENERLGTTPATLVLERSSDHRIDLELPGYRPASVVLTNEFNPVTLGNIAGCIFGLGIPGLIGFAVDFATGAAYKLSPEQVIGQLEREGAALEDIDPDSVHVFVTLDPDPRWELVGYLQPEAHSQRLVIELAR